MKMADLSKIKNHKKKESGFNYKYKGISISNYKSFDNYELFDHLSYSQNYL